MQAKHLKIYDASRKTRIGLWFRRRVLGHLIVTGRELKKIVRKTQVAPRLLKNDRLYGVIITNRPKAE